MKAWKAYMNYDGRQGKDVCIDECVSVREGEGRIGKDYVMGGR